jgi:hypothetical protein
MAVTKARKGRDLAAILMEVRTRLPLFVESVRRRKGQSDFWRLDPATVLYNPVSHTSRQ